jgi:RNA polymerase sigma-70 factor (ECF subfamily)
MRRLRNRHDVDDLAQEVCLRVLRIEESKLVHKPLAYLYGIAAHVLADYRTEQEHDHKHIIFDANGQDAAATEPAARHLTDNLIERLNLQQQIERALSRLPSMHAAVLVAHKRDGLSYGEVAEKFRLSIHTVEKYVTQAKAQLRMIRWER